MYPADYGIGSCKAHDVYLYPICADENNLPLADAPSSCETKWCFVPAGCMASDVQPSPIFPDLSLSYTVCGNSITTGTGEANPVDNVGETGDDKEIPNLCEQLENDLDAAQDEDCGDLDQEQCET